MASTKNGAPSRNEATPSLRLAYRTRRGVMFQGSAEDFLDSPASKRYRKAVQLIFTSPPFPLNRKKRYGNLQGEKYVTWLADFAPRFRDLLKPDGSIVMELGNAWEPGQPVMSTLALRALLAFMEKGHLHLCQQFICYNPARLPGPVQWVNVERIRVKDSFTHVWWMAPGNRPKADNRKVLKEYSASMLKLLRSKKYNPGKRPSQHNIGAESFLQDNKGAIPSNVLTLPNTLTNDPYQSFCRANNIEAHPARMPMGLPEFFVKFLTDPRNLVLDPFAGSNTTGAAAEDLKRRWIAIEPRDEYVRGSKGRFAGGV
jgi:site-specific DNA-methyltransferase (cytosine-N4-specific)